MKEAIIFLIIFSGAFVWGFLTGKTYTQIRTISTVKHIAKCEEKLPRNQHCIAKVVTEVYKPENR